MAALRKQAEWQRTPAIRPKVATLGDDFGRIAAIRPKVATRGASALPFGPIPQRQARLAGRSRLHAPPRKDRQPHDDLSETRNREFNSQLNFRRSAPQAPHPCGTIVPSDRRRPPSPSGGLEVPRGRVHLVHTVHRHALRGAGRLALDLEAQVNLVGSPQTRKSRPARRLFSGREPTDALPNRRVLSPCRHRLYPTRA